MGNINIVLHKINDAIVSDESAATIAYWQEHDNNTLDADICDILKAISFLARCAYEQEDRERETSMRHVMSLSQIAEKLEVFKK